jgi:hypothetical protein
MLQPPPGRAASVICLKYEAVKLYAYLDAQSQNCVQIYSVKRHLNCMSIPLFLDDMLVV